MVPSLTVAAHRPRSAQQNIWPGVVWEKNVPAGWAPTALRSCDGPQEWAIFGGWVGARAISAPRRTAPWHTNTGQCRTVSRVRDNERHLVGLPGTWLGTDWGGGQEECSIGRASLSVTRSAAKEPPTHSENRIRAAQYRRTAPPRCSAFVGALMGPSVPLHTTVGHSQNQPAAAPLLGPVCVERGRGWHPSFSPPGIN